MIVTYAFRSLVANRRSVIPTILVIAATTAAITIVLSLLEGLFTMIGSTGHGANAIVIAKNAESDAESSLTIPAVEQIGATSGVSLMSPEFITSFPFRTADGDFGYVPVRGVDSAAFKVHDEVKITSGAAPAKGVPGVLIGARQVGAYEGFVVGGSIRIGRYMWPVVGVFSAASSFLESELWCDRTALKEITHDDHVSDVYVRLESAAGQSAFAEEIAKHRGEPMRALSEPAYYRLQLKQFALYLNTIVAIVLMLVIGAVFAGTNAMYASFLTRLGELATLIALGYTRRRVAVMMLFESVLLCCIGCAIGVVIGGSLSNGYAISLPEFALTYLLRVTPRVLCASIGIALLMGALSGVVVVAQTLRLHVLSALRS